MAEAVSATGENYQPVHVEQQQLEDDDDDYDYDVNNDSPSRSSNSWVLFLCFWMLGLLNNSSYVIMIACAVSHD